jgi:hypothetical protein
MGLTHQRLTSRIVFLFVVMSDLLWLRNLTLVFGSASVIVRLTLFVVVLFAIVVFLLF